MHFQQAVQSIRTTGWGWWLFSTVILCGLGETIGWAGRIWSAHDVNSIAAYIMQCASSSDMWSTVHLLMALQEHLSGPGAHPVARSSVHHFLASGRTARSAVQSLVSANV